MGEDWQEVPSRNHRRSNADDVSKVAKSVFVTNIPEFVSARDLWKSCSVYGTVVDVFIPSKNQKQYSNARPGSYANVVNGASPGSYRSLLSTSP
nr:RNA-directed DNA polymerase, eukaryota, nucleotide-binding alpha-beta plait domain protein [Tanacetum cinerariifolium]